MNVRSVVPDHQNIAGLPQTTRYARFRFYTALALCDGLALTLAFSLAAAARQNQNWTRILLVALPIFGLLNFNTRAYTIRALRSAATGTADAVRSLALTFGLLFLISYFLKVERDLPRLLLIGTAALAALLITAFRTAMGNLLKRRTANRFVSELVLLDGVELAVAKGVMFARASDFDLRPDLRDPVMLDRFASILRSLDRVVIACTPERRSAWAMMLKGANVQGEVLAPELEAIGPLHLDRLGRHATLVVSMGALQMRYRLIKRALDLGLTIPILIALAPVFVGTAIAIKLDSRGPVFFRQRRVGRGNAFFEVLKFRSMRVEACDEDGGVSTQRDDGRITRVGRFIRRTSIDELPQLLNVLGGSMSLVGPRPHALGSTAGDQLFWDVDQRYWHRHALKPGITGLAQVRGLRGATHKREDLTLRLQADLEYAAGWSVWRDIRILFSTFQVIIHPNSY